MRTLLRSTSAGSLAGLLVAVAAVTAALAVPRSADAALICVHGPSSECGPGEIDKQEDLQGAFNMARLSVGPDRIFVADKGSPYVGPFEYDPGDTPGQTISVEGRGRPELTSTGSDDVVDLRFAAVEDIDVVAPRLAGSGVTLIDGSLRSVAVSGAPEAGIRTAGDVDLADVEVDITGPIAVSSVDDLVVDDSSLRAGGTDIVVSRGTADVTRSRLQAPTQGVLAFPDTAVRLDRSLVRTTEDDSAGVSTVEGDLELEHVTLAGRSSSGNGLAGIIAIGSAGDTVAANSIVLTGYEAGVKRSGGNEVIINDSVWDNSNDDFGGTAFTERNNFHVDPRLVDPAGGDFRLRGSSEAIDSSDHLSAEPYHDIDGQAAVDGEGTGAADPDSGAFEYRRRPPRIESATVPPSSTVRAPVEVAAAAGDPDGDAVELSWDFGDGATASGDQASHAFAEAGAHTITLTARDEGGVTETRSFTINVTEPSGEDVQPDTTAPDTAIKGRKLLRKRKATFSLTATEPGSRFECSLDRKRFAACPSTFKVRKLAPRKHRLVARAIDSAGNVDQTPATLGFKVKRPRR